MEWNKVIYADCMNEDNGLPTLEDKSIDLCLTDPLYNVNAKPNSLVNHNNINYKTPKSVGYNDNIKEYDKFSIRWFTEIKRVCKKLIFTPGSTENLCMWIKIEKPVELFIHYKKNCQSKLSLCRFNRFETILLYGKFKHQLDFMTNVFDIPLESGFRRRKDIELIHPHYKPFQLYYEIIYRLNPKSVIDPFIGSGTTAEVCKKLNIPWIGYEINKIYKQDIENRLKQINRTKSGVLGWI